MTTAADIGKLVLDMPYDQTAGNEEDLPPIEDDAPITDDATDDHGETHSDSAIPNEDKDGEETDADETGEESTDEGAEETLLTVDNKSIKIPKDTPPEVIEAVKGLEKDLRAGFTKKTMELAEQRKSVEADKASARAEVLEQASREIQKQAASLDALVPLVSDEIMDRLVAENPVEYHKALRHNQKVMAQRQQLQQQFAEVDARLNAEKEAARRSRAEQAWSELAEDGYDEGKLKELFVGVSKEFGITDFGEVLDSKTVRMMAEAMKWRRLQSEKSATKRKVDAVTAATSAPQTTSRAPERRRDDGGRYKPATYSRQELGQKLAKLF